MIAAAAHAANYGTFLDHLRAIAAAGGAVALLFTLPKIGRVCSSRSERRPHTSSRDGQPLRVVGNRSRVPAGSPPAVRRPEPRTVGAR